MAIPCEDVKVREITFSSVKSGRKKRMSDPVMIMRRPSGSATIERQEPTNVPVRTNKVCVNVGLAGSESRMWHSLVAFTVQICLPFAVNAKLDMLLPVTFTRFESFTPKPRGPSLVISNRSKLFWHPDGDMWTARKRPSGE